MTEKQNTKQEFKRRSVAQDPHFKLYKAKKSWLIGSAVLASVGIGAFGSNISDVKADDNPSAVKTSAIANDTVDSSSSANSSANSSAAVKTTDLGNASAADVQTAKSAANADYTATATPQKVTATQSLTDLSSNLGLNSGSTAVSDGNNLTITLKAGDFLNKAQQAKIEAYLAANPSVKLKDDSSERSIVTQNDDGKEYREADPLSDVNSPTDKTPGGWYFNLDSGGLTTDVNTFNEGVGYSHAERTNSVDLIAYPDSRIAVNLPTANEQYWIKLGSTVLASGSVDHANSNNVGNSNDRWYAILSATDSEKIIRAMAYAAANNLTLTNGVTFTDSGTNKKDPNTGETVLSVTDNASIEGYKDFTTAVNVTIVEPDGTKNTVSFSGTGTINVTDTNGDGTLSDTELLDTSKDTPATVTTDVSAQLAAYQDKSKYTISTSGDLSDPDLDGKSSTDIGFDDAVNGVTPTLTYTITAKDDGGTVTYYNVTGVTKPASGYSPSNANSTVTSQAIGTGTAGDAITYSASTATNNAISNYNVVQSNLPAAGDTFGGSESHAYAVYLVDKTTEHAAPSDSSDPHYATTHKSFTVTVNQQTPSGNQIVTQKVAYTRTYTTDDVTGQVVSYGKWSMVSPFTPITPASVANYQATPASISTSTASDSGQSLTDLLTAFQNGTAGAATTATFTVTYKEITKPATKPSTPVKQPTTPVSTPPAKTPATPATTPVVTNPPVTPIATTQVTTNSHIPYTPQTFLVRYSTVTILYVDDDTGKILKYEVLTGVVGTEVNFDTYQFIHDLQMQGYFISMNGTDGAIFGTRGMTFRVYMHQGAAAAGDKGDSAGPHKKHKPAAKKKTVLRTHKKNSHSFRLDDPITVDDTDAILGFTLDDPGAGKKRSELAQFFISLSGRVNFGYFFKSVPDDE